MISRCVKFLKWRMETGRPLQRCVLEWGSPPSIDVTDGLPYLDTAGTYFPSLCDIFTSWEVSDT